MKKEDLDELLAQVAIVGPDHVHVAVDQVRANILADMRMQAENVLRKAYFIQMHMRHVKEPALHEQVQPAMPLFCMSGSFSQYIFNSSASQFNGTHESTRFRDCHSQTHKTPSCSSRASSNRRRPDGPKHGAPRKRYGIAQVVQLPFIK